MSRIMRWIDHDNARVDEILASRSTHWLVVRTLFGILVSAKGIALAVHASYAWHYALAPLLFAGGIMFAFESAKIIFGRVRAASEARKSRQRYLRACYFSGPRSRAQSDPQ